jgi:hypothetical protein
MAVKKRFSLKLKKFEFELEMLDGSVFACEIRELTGAERDSYLNFTISKAKVGPDGKLGGMTDATGLQSELLALCLYDQTGQKVPREIVDTWPADTQTQLFEEAQRLSGLDREAVKAAKNA